MIWEQANLSQTSFRNYICFDERRECTSYINFDYCSDSCKIFAERYSHSDVKTISMGEFPAYCLLESNQISIPTELFLRSMFEQSDTGGLISNHDIRQLVKIEDKRITCEKISVLSINLTEEIGEIKLKFRKSYKSLINKGLREASIVEITGTKVEAKLRYKLRALHFRSAKKRTRSYSKWNMQFQQIENGDAILICVYKDRRIINFSIFSLLDLVAYYQTGVNAPDCEVNYGSHLAIFGAISALKEKKMSILILSEHSLNSLSKKEKNIVHFKAGLARQENHYFKFVW